MQKLQLKRSLFQAHPPIVRTADRRLIVLMQKQFEAVQTQLSQLLIFWLNTKKEKINENLRFMCYLYIYSGSINQLEIIKYKLTGNV